MIKRDYFSFFALLLAASLTLTACDSNEADDTEVEVEVTETVSETTVTTSDPAVQNIIAQITSGALADVVGDNIDVDNSAGAIIQTTTSTTTTPSSGGSSSTVNTSTTVAPLVNLTTGQPTGQVAVSVTQTATGQAAQAVTAVVTPNLSNPANVSVPAISSTGNQTTSAFDSVFEPAALTSTDSGWLENRDFYLNEIVSQGGTFATFDSGNGQSWAERIQAALAAGKRRDANLTFAGYTFGTLEKLQRVAKVVSSSCGANSSSATITAVSDFSVVFQCSGIPNFIVAILP